MIGGGCACWLCAVRAWRVCRAWVCESRGEEGDLQPQDWGGGGGDIGERGGGGVVSVRVAPVRCVLGVSYFTN